jgi:hypothetical protein
MHDMRNMPPLVAKKIGANCEARFCNLRHRPCMEISGAAANMQEAQASRGICRIGSRGVAVIARTAQEWGVTE